MRRLAVVMSVLLLVAGACSSGGSDGAPTTVRPTPEATTAASTSTTTAPQPSRYREIVETLASEAMDGRNNTTPGSTMAQTYLVGQLREFAKPAAKDFRHPFA